MHEVHTFILRVLPPPAGVRTDWMFGFQRRLVRRCEWDTLWPKPGPLPQTSHTLATGHSWNKIVWDPADAGSCWCSSPAGSAVLLVRGYRTASVQATWPGYPMPR